MLYILKAVGIHSTLPVADERSPALSAEPFVTVEVIILWILGNWYSPIA